MNSKKNKLKPAEVVIFNNENFNNSTDSRAGSAKDVERLKETFGTVLKCRVETINDATVGQIRKTVQKLEQKDLRDRSALVVVILSHGHRHETIAAKDGNYNLISDIIHPISRNETLKDKLKILFIQACKGAKVVTRFKRMVCDVPSLPADILMCFSSYEGFVSYRTKDGTPFIRGLCETLEENPQVDIKENMKHVLKLVMKSTNNGQVPQVTSTLVTKYAFGDYI